MTLFFREGSVGLAERGPPKEQRCLGKARSPGVTDGVLNSLRTLPRGGSFEVGHLTLMAGGSLALATDCVTLSTLHLAEPGLWMLWCRLSHCK